MKRLLLILPFTLVLLFSTATNAQCPAGFTQTSINWDALAFLVQGGNVTNTMATNQNFAFGKNRLTISHNYPADRTDGDNTIHTGSAGSYGDGADVEFSGDGTIVLTFQTAVRNLRFSLYDIDYNQRVTITATEGAASRNIAMSTLAGSILTIGGNGTTSASATAGATSVVANTSSAGTVNIDITDPVTQVQIVISQTATRTTGPSSGQETGVFWLSDIAACSVTDPFPSNYREVSRPFTGQPGYILVARNNIVYMTDPATGRSVEVFRDPSNQNINSMGYDPYNKILYFTNSLTGANGSANPNNRTLKKYNFDTETLSIVTSDITATLGIPVFGSGVESGGASFYDGALYLGIEGTSSTRSIIWRIDFDNNLNPVSAVQAFGIALTGHDWGDFVIANGVLYDFDGAASGQENIYHVNLQTGAYTATYGSLNFGIRQASANWNDVVYNIGGAPSSTGEVAPYNYNGTVNTGLRRNITVNGVSPSGSWGDAAEAFKPKSDFGDAPASYDPDPLSPAMHDRDINLSLGATLSYEWDKLTSSNASGDGGDDGLTYVRILNLNGGNYQTEVNVFNNTGSNATVCAWVDFNGDGVFQAGEGIVRTVGSSPNMQVVDLYWSGITANLPSNSHTFLRIRITSAANNMTTSDPTGFFMNGEVEDYYVIVNATPLAVNLLHFSVKENNEKAQIEWIVSNETKGTTYALQRSNDGVRWITINEQQSVHSSVHAKYGYTDNQPEKPVSFYRIGISEAGRPTQYSNIQKLSFGTVKLLKSYPNPVDNLLRLELNAETAGSMLITVYDGNGKQVLAKSYSIQKGFNNISVPVDVLTKGIYTLQASASHATLSEKFIKH